MTSLSNLASAKKYKKYKLIFWASAISPLLFSLLAVFLLFEFPDVTGWRLLLLRIVGMISVFASFLLLVVTIKAVNEKNGRLLVKAFGFITEKPDFWSQFLKLPLDYFGSSLPALPESPSGDKLWTELVPEEMELNKLRQPEISVNPIRQKNQLSAHPLEPKDSDHL